MAEHPPILCAGAGTGPDAVLVARPGEIARESWGPRPNARREKITFGPPGLYQDAEFYVRTAVLRQPGWREGARGPRVQTPADVAGILEHLSQLDHERVVVLMLDEKARLMAIQEAGVGGLHGCAVTPKDVLRLPVLVGASSFVIVHNHPSGDPTPSPDDVKMTRSLERAGAAIGVELLDHVVLTRGPVWTSIGALGGTLSLKSLAPAADQTLTDPRKASELALLPYGKYARFLVRSALVESEDRPDVRPLISGYAEVLASAPVERLLAEAGGPERTVTLCLDGMNGLMAVHVAKGPVHAPSAARIYAVATTVPSSGIILVHNHPDGTDPGELDRQLSAMLMASFDAIGITLLDQVVVRPRAGGGAIASSLLAIPGMMRP